MKYAPAMTLLAYGASLALAVPIALVVADATYTSSCVSTPGAYGERVTTTGHDDPPFSSSCSVERPNGTTVEDLQVNWTGLVAALSILIGALLTTAFLLGRLSCREWLLSSSLVVLVMSFAVGLYFV